MSPPKTSPSSSPPQKPPGKHTSTAPGGDDGHEKFDVEGRGLPVDHPDRKRLPPLLRMAWFSLNQSFRRRISHLNITPDQFTILRWLTECDPDWPTQRQLGDMMASDPNTITSLLKRMEDHGVVKRQPDDKDKRANRIHITAEGKRVYHKARKIAIDLQGEVLTCLPAEKRDEFFDLLETVAHTCREMVEGKAPRDGE